MATSLANRSESLAEFRGSRPEPIVARIAERERHACSPREGIIAIYADAREKEGLAVIMKMYFCAKVNLTVGILTDGGRLRRGAARRRRDFAGRVARRSTRPRVFDRYVDSANDRFDEASSSPSLSLSLLFFLSGAATTEIAESRRFTAE